jgi:hypothetical protein
VPGALPYRAQMPKKGKKAASEPAGRSFADATFDAIPDVVAAGLCLLAWTAPHSLPRFDLIAVAAPLFYIQLPLSILGLMGGVTRLKDSEMSRRTKAGFLLLPAAIVMVLSPILLGPWALLGVGWLSAGLLWRVALGRIDTEAAIKGAWIEFEEGDGKRSVGIGDSGSKRRRAKARRWRVEAGHTQVMAGLTIAAGMVLFFLVPFLDVSALGITADLQAASVWSKTVVGAIQPAEQSLAAGTALFVARALMQYEGLTPRPGTPEAAKVPNIDDDPVLRDIVRKVEGKSPTHNPQSKQRT